MEIRVSSIVFLFLLGSISLSAKTSLDKAKDELLLKNKTTKQEGSLQPTSFSTVSITRKFSEEKVSSGNKVSVGFVTRDMNPGLLGNTSGNIDFTDVQSLQLSYQMKLNRKFFVDFSGAYGISQSEMTLIDKQQEKINFNLFELSSSVAYQFYQNNYFSSELSAGLKQLSFVQVSESGLRDSRKQKLAPAVGIKLNSPYYFSDKVRYVIGFEKLLGELEGSLLLETSSYQFNLEIKL